MTAITDARDAYLAARRAVTETRLALGSAIADARAKGVEQVDIARKLGLTREQIRRYEAEYRESAGA
jgi:transcriptional regulator